MKRMLNGATVVLSLILITPLHAQMKTGASTLLLGGSARAMAMRGAYTAAAGDLDAMVFNPGGLSAIGRAQIGFTHAETALDADYDLIQYAQPQKFGTWGVSLARLGVKDFEGRDAQRQRTGSQSASDLMASVSFSRDFQAMVGVGASVKFFESRIASDKASTVALDLGSVVKVPNRPLWLGASALNIAHGLRFEAESTPLPLMLNIGAATRLANAVNLTIDLKRTVRNRETDVVTGIEYFLLPTAALRLGYGSSLSGSDQTALNGFGNWKGGLGLAISSYQLDYAISSDSESDPMHRISLSRVF